MKTKLTWDESKRQANWQKHGFDFSDAGEVLDSRFRMDTLVVRSGEIRMTSISYALKFLLVLSVVHTERAQAVRVISFRRASRKEREQYYVWIKNEYDEP